VARLPAASGAASGALALIAGAATSALANPPLSTASPAASCSMRLDRPALANAIAERQTRSASPRARATPVVIKLEHLRDRPLRFAPLWKTADVGSVFRFSGALDGFANPQASAQYWCRKYRPDGTLTLWAGPRPGPSSNWDAGG
jgi:hypothetical protein